MTETAVAITPSDATVMVRAPSPRPAFEPQLMNSAADIQSLYKTADRALHDLRRTMQETAETIRTLEARLALYRAHQHTLRREEALRVDQLRVLRASIHALEDQQVAARRVEEAHAIPL